jgi:hypothetical protein
VSARSVLECAIPQWARMCAALTGPIFGTAIRRSRSRAVWSKGGGAARIWVELDCSGREFLLQRRSCAAYLVCLRKRPPRLLARSGRDTCGGAARCHAGDSGVAAGRPSNRHPLRSRTGRPAPVCRLGQIGSRELGRRGRGSQRRRSVDGGTGGDPVRRLAWGGAAPCSLLRYARRAV